MDNAGNVIADFDQYDIATHRNRLGRIMSNNKEVRRYDYDLIGRMTYEENSDGEKFVSYDVSGKVTAVYKRKDANGNLKFPMVMFGYDDRGFRLFKTAFNAEGTTKTKTTCYVRDATGNVVGTYEEDHEAQEAPSLVEVPVYGSGRIGMYKPAYGQTLYEVTDHLGNVRAVVGGAVQITMLATMEQERQEKENKDFFGMRTTVTATDINHTTSTVTIDGNIELVEANKVIRLNNRPNGRYGPNPIGGGTMLWVHPGDTIRAEAFAKYARIEEKQNKSQLIALAAMLKNLSPMDNAVEMRKAFQMLSRSDFRSLPVWGKLDDAQPPAFLNGLLFDKDMKLQSFDFDQVSEKARIKPLETKGDHEKLELEFVAEKEGYLYIYISNESKENLDVYFDDLKVTHVYGTVVAGGDYYPYGLPIEDRQITLEDYRFGYQGQFAERDEETEWNHFELRQYDPVIGRWTSTDPYGQYWSPYVNVGNDPINFVDPSGGTGGPARQPLQSNSSLGLAVLAANGTTFFDPINIVPDNPTPWQVGAEWLTGAGPRDRAFMDGDMFTEMLKQHSHVAETLNIIIDGLANGNKLPGENPYSLGGLQGVGKYAKDYSTLATGGTTGNLAVTYLGSYNLKYTISSVDIANRTATVHFSVNNSSTIQSATRPPVIGYTSWWRNNIGNKMNDALKSGPMSTTTQTFDWTETIKY